MPTDVEKDNIDLLSFSGHKIYGPKGIGALYVRRKKPRVRLQSLFDGGGQERGFRSGTLNVTGIVGLGKACEIAMNEMEHDAARLFKLRKHMEDSLLKSLVVDGIIAGISGVVIFLPQILILFLFILLLEDFGYMTRAAFLMDRLMARVGLNGRAFIPLLSSFACAVPGIMATRTIDSPRDRLTTILIAPLMTCSARLPVYAVVIGAFIPARDVGPFGLQGLVLFALYLAGILGALVAAFALRRTVTKGAAPPFLMEMPKYQWPALRDVGLGLYGRATAFLQRAGTIILASTIVLWAMASWPQPPVGANKPAIDYSLAGKIGAALEPAFAPIGFNKEIVIALVPGMAAREVAVSALGTVYALNDVSEDNAGSLIERLRSAWPLPTALAFLAWFVFAPQCISTLAITRRETASWRWPIFMFSYLFAAAYVAAGITYHLALAAGL
jgi:ferrous iron transport protein B